MHQEIITVISQKKSKQKSIRKILQSIGIIVIRSKENRMITYTCRYSSGNLIPIIQDGLGIKYPLEYLQVQVITLVSSLFIIMIPIDCKITKFCLCLYTYYIHTCLWSWRSLYWIQGYQTVLAVDRKHQ